MFARHLEVLRRSMAGCQGLQEGLGEFPPKDDRHRWGPKIMNRFQGKTHFEYNRV